MLPLSTSSFSFFACKTHKPFQRFPSWWRSFFSISIKSVWTPGQTELFESLLEDRFSIARSLLITILQGFAHQSGSQNCFKPFNLNNNCKDKLWRLFRFFVFARVWLTQQLTYKVPDKNHICFITCVWKICCYWSQKCQYVHSWVTGHSFYEFQAVNYRTELMEQYSSQFHTNFSQWGPLYRLPHIHLLGQAAWTAIEHAVTTRLHHRDPLSPQTAEYIRSCSLNTVN